MLQNIKIMGFVFSDFIEKYQSGIFTIIGILIAFTLGFYEKWFMQNRDRRLEISRELSKERIHAHLEILDVVNDLTKYSTIDQIKINTGEFIVTCPEIFISKEHFYGWHKRFGEVSKKNMFWVNIKVYKELRFLSMLIRKIEYYIRNLPEKMIEIGIVSSNDLGQIRDNVANQIRDYFDKEIFQEHTKHYSWLIPESEFKSRYESTNVFNFIEEKANAQE